MMFIYSILAVLIVTFAACLLNLVLGLPETLGVLALCLGALTYEILTDRSPV